MSTDECDTPEECSWTTYSDWEGDPSVPNGTHSWTVYVCRHCGSEVTTKPDNYKGEEYDSD